MCADVAGQKAVGVSLPSPCLSTWPDPSAAFHLSQPCPAFALWIALLCLTP